MKPCHTPNCHNKALKQGNYCRICRNKKLYDYEKWIQSLTDWQLFVNSYGNTVYCRRKYQAFVAAKDRIGRAMERI
jgi:hypothetical protein